MYAVELKIIQGFKPTKNEWYVKESGRRRRFATPIAEGVGSSSQPKKKQKKKIQTILVDEPEDDIPTDDVEKEQEVSTGEDFMLDTDVFETGTEVVADVDKEKEKTVDDIEGDDVDKDTTSSSSMSEFEMVDTRESEKRMREELEKEKLLRKRKRTEKEDELYVPSPEHDSASKSSSRVTKKVGGRKKSTSKVRMTKRPQKILNTPPSQATSSHQLTPPQSPIHQSPPLLKLEKRIDEVIAENKKWVDECKRITERERFLAGKVQRLEVRVSELEEEKSRRESENEYYKLKNKELMAAKALHEHKFYMLNRVVESMLETSVEQKYEELKLDDLRAERKAEVERQMKDKGKAVEGSSAMSIVPSMVVDNPVPISSVPGDDDDDAARDSGVRVTEAAKEKVVEDLLNDTVNEESGEAGGKGESSKNQIVEHHEPLFLCLDVYREMLNDVNPENPIDLEADLESFDINKQKDYKYNYVADADQYDRVEVEDCSDNEDVPEDTSKLPTLMEFFTAENRDELRQKVTEAVNENVFECLRKEAEQVNQSNVEKEDHSKWFKDGHERKFKRPLNWGFLPQVNAYAVRREFGVQYFKRLYDIMSLPWWDVDELSQVRTLEYEVRQNDKAMWGFKSVIMT
ncbi:uncharacterized protein LOC110906855 [Helianthus annuus]|uniref:uncharacterized protein LOC110906855 n=1 Tax=Helianthus annuus TaxID=4232 RepID=UPI000B8F2017|nr:uncharacterized protein LOC110906855 [Helianthus annuus]